MAIADRPPRILVTGFGGFPGVPDNASAAVGVALARRLAQALPGAPVRSAVLPVEWETAPRQLGQLMAQEPPDVCFHLGVSVRVRGVVMEPMACNWAGRKRDAAGWFPSSDQLLVGAPMQLRPHVNPEPLVRLMALEQLPIACSPAASDYLCNAIFFHSLWLARQPETGQRRLVLFAHLPVRVGTAGQVDGVDCQPSAALSMAAAVSTLMRVLTGLLLEFKSTE